MRLTSRASFRRLQRLSIKKNQRWEGEEDKKQSYASGHSRGEKRNRLIVLASRERNQAYVHADGMQWTNHLLGQLVPSVKSQLGPICLPADEIKSTPFPTWRGSFTRGQLLRGVELGVRGARVAGSRVWV